MEVRDYCTAPATGQWTSRSGGVRLSIPYVRRRPAGEAVAAAGWGRRQQPRAGARGRRAPLRAPDADRLRNAGLLVTIALDRTAGGSILSGWNGFLLPSVAALMAAVGMLAALGPARRALAIQPTEALRDE